MWPTKHKIASKIENKWIELCVFLYINMENEQEYYYRILLKSQFGQMSQICDYRPIRVNSQIV